jgi:hypothetical protein
MVKNNGMMDGAMTPQGDMMTDNEPGAVDNRLSLDPNNPSWSDAIANWEDGKEYSVEVRLRQMSPGEFEVLEFTADSGEEEPSGTESEELSKGATGGGGSNPAVKNPAVAALIAKNRPTG